MYLIVGSSYSSFSRVSLVIPLPSKVITGYQSYLFIYLFINNMPFYFVTEYQYILNEE